MNDTATSAVMNRLLALAGCWSGTGSGRYPTIDPFEYDETLRFDADASYPLLHYEQRTHLRPSGEPSHWESGFIRPLENGTIEISNAQEGGRVEVLRGRRVATEDDDELKLVFDSIVLAHDPRLERTRRIFTLRGDTLHYEVLMATHTTPKPLLGPHLTATLKRQA